MSSPQSRHSPARGAGPLSATRGHEAIALITHALAFRGMNHPRGAEDCYVAAPSRGAPELRDQDLRSSLAQALRPT